MQGSNKELVEVNWEDQQNINAFADLIRKHTVVKVSMDDKKVHTPPVDYVVVTQHHLINMLTAMQKRCEHLDEAQTELMLVDEEDSTRYLIGECFLHIPNDDADQRLGTGSNSIEYLVAILVWSSPGFMRCCAELAQLQKEIGDLEAEESELQGTRDALKEVGDCMCTVSWEQTAAGICVLIVQQQDQQQAAVQKLYSKFGDQINLDE